MSLFHPSALGPGETVAVVGTMVSVGTTSTSAVLVSMASMGGDSCALVSRLGAPPTPTAKNSRTKAIMHTQRFITFTVLPRVEVGLFMSSPFFRFSGGEQIVHQSALPLRREA
jgi:hypothetical protein